MLSNSSLTLSAIDILYNYLNSSMFCLILFSSYDIYASYALAVA